MSVRRRHEHDNSKPNVYPCMGKRTSKPHCQEVEPDHAALAPPCFVEPVFSKACVSHDEGVGYLVLSQSSRRRFFCPEGSPRLHTQFSGSVARCWEVWPGAEDPSLCNPDMEDSDEEATFFTFRGRMFKYFLSFPLAMKMCPVEVVKQEAAWQGRKPGEMFGEDPLKEVAALQILQSHPNVEELEEAMADHDTIYKITPWYEGGELFDLAPMPEASAKDIFAQLLDALDFVHSRGVCHRDISLENVLLDVRSPDRSAACRSGSISSIGSCASVASSGFSTSPDSDISEATGRGALPGRRDIRVTHGVPQNDNAWVGRPRLCDFGMSVRIPKSKMTGRRSRITPQGRCGKNTCVAPEVFYDQVFDAQAVDSWSLGTTLFMALLGVQPWEEVGDNKFQAIAENRSLSEVLERWSLRDQLSDDAVNLLQAMLTADPEERLSDIDSILAHPWFTRS